MEKGRECEDEMKRENKQSSEGVSEGRDDL